MLNFREELSKIKQRKEAELENAKIQEEVESFLKDFLQALEKEKLSKLQEGFKVYFAVYVRRISAKEKGGSKTIYLKEFEEPNKAFSVFCRLKNQFEQEGLEIDDELKLNRKCLDSFSVFIKS